LSGAYISYVAPSMPTGPWIVIVISFIAFFSFFFAPRRGILSRLTRQRFIRRNINDENVLKIFYQLGEGDKGFFINQSVESLLQKRFYKTADLRRILRRLEQQGYLDRQGEQWVLTAEGKARGQRIVKNHRLWELYLTTYMRIAPDHVHEDADTIEHLLTPELEAELERQLDYPVRDPHQSEIPYSEKL
jgi:manganese/zinc/iron transport system permease protein